MRQFNVSVLLTLNNKVSRGLSTVSRDFSAVERRFQALQRSINDLQARRGLTAQRVRTTQALERQGTSGLQQRLALMQQLTATEQGAQAARIEAMQVEAAERARMARIQAEQLGGLERRAAMQRVVAREAADAQRIQLAQADLQAQQQARQLRMAEMQAAITRRNAVAQLRATEAENRLLRQRQAIQARNDELAAMRSRGRSRMFLTGGGIALAATAAVSYEAVKAGLPVGLYLQQIATAGHLTRAQRTQLPDIALALSQRSTGGQFNYKQVLQAMRRLVGPFGFARTTALAPQVFALSALAKEQGMGTDLSGMSSSIFQTMTMARARTPAQRSALIRAMTTLMYRGGVTPEAFGSTLRAMRVGGIRESFGQTLRAAELTSAVMSQAGHTPGLSDTAVANLFRGLETPAAGAGIGLRALLHLPARGPLTNAQVLAAIEHAKPGMNFPQRLLGRKGMDLRTMFALQAAQHGGLLARSQRMIATQLDPQVLLARSLTTAEPAMRRLGSSLDNFVSVIGARAGHRLADPASRLSALLNRATLDMQHGAGNAAWTTNLLNRLGHGEANLLAAPFKYIFSGGPNFPFPHGMIPRTPTVIHNHHNTVHVKTTSDSQVKHLVRALKSGVLSHGTANPVGVAPQLYGGEANGPG